MYFVLDKVVISNSCNIGRKALPDMHAQYLSPAYIATNMLLFQWANSLPITT